MAARLVLEGGSGRLTDQKVIFRMNRFTTTDRHFGSRIVIGKDGNLFVTLGERGEGARAQDFGDLAGAVVRIAPGRLGAGRQSEAGGLGAGAVEQGASQPAGRDAAGKRRRLVHRRARRAGRRRAEHAAGGPELRLAGDPLRRRLLGGPDRRGHADGGDGAAAVRPGPLDRAVGATSTTGALFATGRATCSWARSPGRNSCASMSRATR